MKKPWILLAAGLCLAGCEDSAGLAYEAIGGTGGTAETGGAEATGGTAATGGATATGGAAATGGATETGGTMDAGMDATVGAGENALTRAALGALLPLPDYAARQVSGAALLVVSATGTRVSVQASGLEPSTDYPTHVHLQPCAMLGGGHYKIDTSIDTTEESNELWPLLSTDADGHAVTEITSSHIASSDAMAVVVHDPAAAGAKMLCVDLVVAANGRLKSDGDLVAFAAAATAGLDSLSGEAEMIRALDGTTEVNLQLTGLAADASYGVHVHNKACTAASGGGHYKLDPSVEETVESNEIWLSVTADSQGAASREVTVSHTARAEAQAVVVHDADNTRLACIPLS